jgi:hypothetical protein
MAKPKNPVAVTHAAEIGALLKRHGCPVPFHAVRTRFLGAMTSPAIGVSPIEEVGRLWGGKLPSFDSIDDANELIQGLIMGLWNRLTKHQEPSAPFRLTRLGTDPTRERIVSVASTRLEELDGFVQGLFGDQDEIDLPERAHHAVKALQEMRAMFAGVLDLALDESKPFDLEGMQGLQGQMREVTRIAEHEIHEAVLSCKRARMQAMASWPASKPTMH